MAFKLFGGKKKSTGGDGLDQQLAQLSVFMDVVGDESSDGEGAAAAPEDDSTPLVNSNQNDPTRRGTLSRIAIARKLSHDKKKKTITNTIMSAFATNFVKRVKIMREFIGESEALLNQQQRGHIKHETDDFNPATESTFVLILRKTRFWHGAESDRHRVEQMHHRILDELETAGMECVLLKQTPAQRKLDTHGVILVGLHHSSREVLLREMRHLRFEMFMKQQSLYSSEEDTATPTDVPDDLELSPSDVILLTDRIIRNTLETLTQNTMGEVRHSANRWVCSAQKAEDIPLDQLFPFCTDRKYSYVANFFPLHDKEVNDKMLQLFKREVANIFSRTYMQAFLDEVLWQYGDKAALYFAFASHTLRYFFPLALLALFINLINIIIRMSVTLSDPSVIDHSSAEVTATKFKFASEGFFGLFTVMLWGPVWIRTWDRKHEILKLRWKLKDNSDVVENQFADSVWKYNERLNRMVRSYNDDWRCCIKFFGIPVLAILFGFTLLTFTFFAFSGALMYQLPSCENCEFMARFTSKEKYLEILTNESTPEHPIAAPYDDYENVDYENATRTWKEFARGWVSQADECKYSLVEKPSDCVAATFFGPFVNLIGHILAGAPRATCWPEPDSIFYGAFAPFIIWTVAGQLVAAVLASLVRKTSMWLTKQENWPTLSEFQKHVTKRRFFVTWAQSYTFNWIFVFFMIPFGQKMLHFWFSQCDLGQTNEALDTILGLRIFGVPPGVWNPANMLIVGEWVGILVDLLLLKLIISMLPFLKSVIKWVIHKQQQKKVRALKAAEKERLEEIAAAESPTEKGICRLTTTLQRSPSQEYHWADMLRGNSDVDIIVAHQRGSFAQYIDFLGVVSRGATTIYFAAFIPFVFCMCWIFTLVEMFINVVEMLYFTQRSVHRHVSSTKNWQWAMNVSVYMAVPLVMLYIVFHTFEMMNCGSVEMDWRQDFIVGVYICKRSHQKNSHLGASEVIDPSQVVLWLVLSILGIFFIHIFFSCFKKIPKVVRDQQRLMSLMIMSNEEASQIEKSLDKKVVASLRVAFSSVDVVHTRRISEHNFATSPSNDGMKRLAELLKKSKTLQEVVDDDATLKRNMSTTITGGAGEVPTEDIETMAEQIIWFHLGDAAHPDHEPSLADCELKLNSFLRTGQLNKSEVAAYMGILSSKDDRSIKQVTTLLMKIERRNLVDQLDFDKDKSGTVRFPEFVLGFRHLLNHPTRLEKKFLIDKNTLIENIHRYKDQVANANQQQKQQQKQSNAVRVFRTFRKLVKRKSSSSGKLLASKSGEARVFPENPVDETQPSPKL